MGGYQVFEACNLPISFASPILSISSPLLSFFCYLLSSTALQSISIFPPIFSAFQLPKPFSLHLSQ